MNYTFVHAIGGPWDNHRPSADADPTTHRFTGHEWDREIDMTYANDRYYDMELGLFTQVDKLVLDGTYLDGEINDGIYNFVNLASYTYVWNSPTKYTDPTGKHAFIYQNGVHAMVVVAQPIPEIDYDDSANPENVNVRWDVYRFNLGKTPTTVSNFVNDGISTLYIDRTEVREGNLILNKVTEFANENYANERFGNEDLQFAMMIPTSTEADEAMIKQGLAIADEEDKGNNTWPFYNCTHHTADIINAGLKEMGVETIDSGWYDPSQVAGRLIKKLWPIKNKLHGVTAQPNAYENVSDYEKEVNDIIINTEMSIIIDACQSTSTG